MNMNFDYKIKDYKIHIWIVLLQFDIGICELRIWLENISSVKYIVYLIIILISQIDTTYMSQFLT